MKYTIYDFVVADRTLVSQGGTYSFRAYTDRVGVFGNPGAVIIYDDGTKDRTGRPIGKAFSIGQSHYKLQARENQKDYAHILLSKFFLNAPFCEASPNGDYIDQDGNQVPIEELKDREKNLKRLRSGEIKQLNVKIKLLEDEKDAEIALDAGLKRAEAQLSVGKIDEDTLSEIAALLGVFGPADQTMRLKVYEFAGKRPIDYFNHLNAGDRGVRAVLRKAIADRVLKLKGSVIMWNETILGNDENSAVSTLLGDKEMLNALSSEVKIKINTKKKK
jgi:hypothetical protein